MKQIFLAFIVAIGLSSTAYAVPQDRADRADASEESEGVNAANRIVCRRFPPPVGSRIGGRNICATQTQWDRYNREVREVLEDAFNRSKGF